MIIVLLIVAAMIGLAIWDVTQERHTILRNFPILGHFRYLLEKIGPELRQYIVTSNDAERPFSRDQRSWVYASSKGENNLFGFGTDNNLDGASNHLIIRHAAFPLDPPEGARYGVGPDWLLPCAKILGGARERTHAFRPESLVLTSAMSFGSLSGPAVQAINMGVRDASALQNTGEGGISDYHRHGGELVWQIGTGYFGCRDEHGGFSLERFRETLASAPVKAIEIKLSQGAKPGKGGILPAAKITPEIARIRGVPLGKDVVSPSHHTAFHDVDSMLDFVEQLAEVSGLPVGIKSAVGEMAFWEHLAETMARDHGRGVDFITIDGGEGGTGAAPLVFSDHISLPYRVGMSSVYRTFAQHDVAERIVWIGSGRLGFPQDALLAMAMGADMIAVAREAMMAIGCIQAQRCHNGHCPTGVATQNPWLVRGLVATDKAPRMARYLKQLRKEIAEVSRACGALHPALLTLEQFDFVAAAMHTSSAREAFGYQPDWGRPNASNQEAIKELMRGNAKQEVA